MLCGRQNTNNKCVFTITLRPASCDLWLTASSRLSHSWRWSSGVLAEYRGLGRFLILVVLYNAVLWRVVWRCGYKCVYDWLGGCTLKYVFEWHSVSTEPINELLSYKKQRLWEGCTKIFLTSYIVGYMEKGRLLGIGLVFILGPFDDSVLTLTYYKNAFPKFTIQ